MVLLSQIVSRRATYKPRFSLGAMKRAPSVECIAI